MGDSQTLFIVAAVWILVAAFVVYFIPIWPARLIVFALLVGVPFWELPYGYYNFRKLCDESRSLQRFEGISPQSKICIEDFDFRLVGDLLAAGFSPIEMRNGSENAREFLASGKLIMMSKGDSKSAYCIIVRNNVRGPWRVLRSDTAIEQSATAKIVARQSAYEWRGMWWQEHAQPLLGRGGLCASDWGELIRTLRAGAG